MAASTSGSVSSFPAISGEESTVDEIESFCVSCEQNGTTRMLMVKIPFFKEVIVSSFSCPHCGYSNSSIMEGEKIQEQGAEYALVVRNAKDLNRTVVMSDFAAVRIPELDFEAPYRRQTFGITTVEGVLSHVKEMTTRYLDARNTGEQEGVDQLKQFINKVDSFMQSGQSFHLVIDDPSGNSFIENPYAPNTDPDLTVRKYRRDADMDALCGLQPEDQDMSDEVLVFPATCYNCGSPCQTNMKNVSVPHFKEILVMSTVCDKCGWKNSEAKPSGGIEDQGIRIELFVAGDKDLNRDVIKSATCSLAIPELEFEMLASDHSSRYSTVEGLISNIKEELVTDNPFVQGDSADPNRTDKLVTFGMSLDEVIAGKRSVHLILDDPAGNSFIEVLENDDKDPSLLKTTRYTRNAEQIDSLGLSDMKTENYDNLEKSVSEKKNVQ